MVELRIPLEKPNWCNCDGAAVANKEYLEIRYPIADRYLPPPGDVAAYRSGQAAEVHWDPPMAARTVYTEGEYLKSRVDDYQLKGYAVYRTAGGGRPEVIVTRPEFVASLRPLAAWKTRRGVPTAIYTTAWIYSHSHSLVWQDLHSPMSVEKVPNPCSPARIKVVEGPM